MSKDKVEQSAEQVAYEKLQAQKKIFEGDLKTVNEIYGKVTATHDYKELARKTNVLREKIEELVKEVNAKLHQWDLHFKAQAAYVEMIRNEETINELVSKYT